MQRATILSPRVLKSTRLFLLSLSSLSLEGIVLEQRRYSGEGGGAGQCGRTDGDAGRLPAAGRDGGLPDGVAQEERHEDLADER